MTNVITTEAAVCINLLCQENHKSIWQSQPTEKKIYLGDVGVSA